ncbi:MAG: hypothetical protein JW990_04035 [Thermoleophilia bacterium]|nr:hypothetical protein [Thermoleophilia bacterium]
MLKVKVDQGGDYLDYLQPFVLQVLVDHRPDPVTTDAVSDHLLTDFGLEIPERVAQLVLKRLSRRHPLMKESGVYRISGRLPDPGIAARKADADRHIQSVLAGLIEFSEDSARRLSNSAEAVEALCSFLGEFDISCLKNHLRGTAIPSVGQKSHADVVLVSQYVLQLERIDPERFGSFQILVQGHMLANALLCPDLASAPQTFRDVVFYLDTPLLVRWLGLEGQYRKDAAEELARLVRRLGGTIATFVHTHDELRAVMRGAADHLEDPNGRSAVVMEARRQGTTRSDLLLLAEQTEERLQELQVEVRPAPAYAADFQIDETAFAGVLDDEVSYYNPRARDYDINSVRAVYVLRKGRAPLSMERAAAVFVTSNAGFARAAFRYGEQYEESREVSPVITDFSLSNMAWLKAPMGAPSLPIAEVLAFSYAALELPKPMLEKFLAEMEKLEKRGRITPRDHQLLRGSFLAHEELMRLTLGEEDALTEHTISETLKRVTDEIKKEENAKYQDEQAAHRRTQEDLAMERATNDKVRERLYWRCYRRASWCSWSVAGLVGLVLLGGIAGGLGLKPSNQIAGWALTVAFGLATVAGGFNLFFGFTIRQWREAFSRKLLAWLLRREAAATTLDLGAKS